MTHSLGAAPYAAPPALSLLERVIAWWRGRADRRRERIAQEQTIEDLFRMIRSTARVVRIAPPTTTIPGTGKRAPQ